MFCQKAKGIDTPLLFKASILLEVLEYSLGNTESIPYGSMKESWGYRETACVFYASKALSRLKEVVTGLCEIPVTEN